MKESNYIEKVHDVTKKIPKGRVSTYGYIADYLALGSARMVGWALSQIPFMDSDIPAHRVVNRKGELSGRNNFPTPETMSQRLISEGVPIENWKVVDFKDRLWHPQELD